MIKLEHVNISVSNPKATATLLTQLFDWRIRWSGAAKDGGFTVHVGEPENGGSYLALYKHLLPNKNQPRSHRSLANLNHIAVTVENLAETEKKVLENGLKPFNFGDYAPGERFYFHLPDDIEVEVVSYAKQKTTGEVLPGVGLAALK